MDTFCKIINKELPATIVYEDDIVLGILDIHPQTPGHTLLIPKKHFEDMHDMDEGTFLHIMGVAKKLADKLKKCYPAVTICHNSGSLSDVPHFHLHIVGAEIKENEISC